jgi:glycosyltransferase involved in cell wall biosynthesis
MKILLSCYFCDPRHPGGEGGIGWRWAVEAAKLGHQVWVIVEGTFREVVEANLKLTSLNVHVIYLELPSVVQRTLDRLGLWRLTYMIWQYEAYRCARALHDEVGFDIVHHLTMGDFRHPSLMGRLGPPFIFGPVGGGERAPMALRWGLGFAGWWSELLRDLGNLLPHVDPLSHQCYRQAAVILVRTPATFESLPKRYRRKSRIMLGLGAGLDPAGPCEAGGSAGLRVLFVGRLIPWKGVHLALRAIAEVARARPDVTLTIVGRGPWERRLRDLSVGLGITTKVTWTTEWIPEERLAELYRTHDVFLFPSLHEAGGSVVVEALAHGLPVVCLDIGGPATIVDQSCGRVVQTKSRSIDDVVRALAEATIELATQPPLRRQLSVGARRRADRYQWPVVVDSVYRAVTEG